MGYSPYFLNKQSSGSSKSTGSNYQNASGSTLTKGTPASINGSSQLVAIDVSDETSVQRFVGLSTVDIPNAATGGMIDNGRLEDVTTSFTVGDAIYVSKTGGLTNIKPSVGVASFVDGDFVIFVGVLVKNEFNPSLKDIQLMLALVGQL